MRIIVAGGGTLGEQVARAMSESGNEVTVVESDSRRAAELRTSGVEVVTGNATLPATLEAAGGLRAGVLVACTSRDEDNLVISLLAKRRLEVPRVVARVNDETNRWLFDESWGVDAAISSASALVALIEEATGSARTVRLADLSAVGLVLVEVNVTPSSVAKGQPVAALPLADRDLVAALVRQGRPISVDTSTVLRVGDRVLVLTDPAGDERVHRAFYPGGEPATG